MSTMYSYDDIIIRSREAIISSGYIGFSEKEIREGILDNHPVMEVAKHAIQNLDTPIDVLRHSKPNLPSMEYRLPSPKPKRGLHTIQRMILWVFAPMLRYLAYRIRETPEKRCINKIKADRYYFNKMMDEVREGRITYIDVIQAQENGYKPKSFSVIK